MEDTNVYEVVFNKKSFDIVAAGTSFYAFIGNRLYYTFDQFLYQEDIKVLHEHMAGMDSRSFIIRLLDKDDVYATFIAILLPGESAECVKMRLYSLDEMMENEEVLHRQRQMKQSILEVYNDSYFEYDVKKDWFRTYSVSHFEHIIFEGGLDAAVQWLKGKTDQKWYVRIDEFAAVIASGRREFEFVEEGDVFYPERNVVSTIIKGISVYEDGEYAYAAGYLHIGKENVSNARKKVERDSLTGVLAKSEITNLAITNIDVKRLKNTTIAIIDVDFFKKVNDTFGHLVGDEVLKKVAAIIEKQVGNEGVVGRIGGDEFFVIFYNVGDMENARERLRSIKNSVRSAFPANKEGKPSITLSIGCAAYPKDADNYEDLFVLSDFALYRAKEKGRNRYIIYNSELHGNLEDIKNTKMKDNRINSRGDMSVGDILCTMMDKVYSGEEYPLEKLLEDFVVDIGIQRIMVYAGEQSHVVCMAGEKRPSGEVLVRTQDYVDDPVFVQMSDERGCLVIDDITYILGKAESVYQKLSDQGVLSFMQFRVRDKAGTPCILSFESVSRRIAWNRSLLPHYRLFARLLAEYELL